MNRDGQGPVPKIILADLGSKEPVYLRTRGSALSQAHLECVRWIQNPLFTPGSACLPQPAGFFFLQPSGKNQRIHRTHP